MRSSRLVLLALLVAAARGHADELSDGEALARDGKFEQAIAHFKALDTRAERAVHACYVALAYRRLERWGQAELFSDRCAARARAEDPAPPWADKLRGEIHAGMDVARGARVTLRVDAPDAVLSVSAFAPDERFAPRTIFLPIGEHRVTVSAPGFEPRAELVTVSGRDPVEVSLALRPTVAAAPPPPVAVVDLEPPPAARRASPVPWIVVGAGGAAAVVGVVFHAAALGKKSDAEKSPAAYDSSIDAFNRDRALAIGAYAAGALAVGVGVYLLMSRHDEPRRPLAVTPLGAGGLVTLEW